MKFLDKMGNWTNTDNSYWRENFIRGKIDDWKAHSYIQIDRHNSEYSLIFGGKLNKFEDLFFSQYQYDELNKMPVEKVMDLVDQFLITIDNLGSFV